MHGIFTGFQFDWPIAEQQISHAVILHMSILHYTTLVHIKVYVKPAPSKQAATGQPMCNNTLLLDSEKV